MKQLKHTVILLLLAMALTAPAWAGEITVDPSAQFCFSAEDFIRSEEEDGVFLTAVPSRSAATIRYGTRILQAGDALPREALNQLTVEAVSSGTVGYYTITDGVVSGLRELKLSILPKKNQPPTAQDGQLETYRNIANSGTLSASDPENGTLVFTIEKEPKRGTVEINEDGSFTYTPEENKVGKDSFTFIATDEAGNASQPATISILIKKPTDKAVYADLSGDADAFTAMWMKEEGLFTGSVVGGNLCFQPDAPVTRGEFLVMAMSLVNAEADELGMLSGFADEAATPVWMQPYIVSALGSGMISGTTTEAGVVFQPEAVLSGAEAAVMMQNILQLPQQRAQAVFASGDDQLLPVWAQDAAAALSTAGIEMEFAAASPMTRLDAGRLLYQVSQWMEQEPLPTFYWMK